MKDVKLCKMEKKIHFSGNHISTVAQRGLPRLLKIKMTESVIDKLLNNSSLEYVIIIWRLKQVH